MTSCSECITKMICKNKILNYLQEFKEYEESIHNIPKTRYFKPTPSLSIIYYAYMFYIEPKCKAISKLFENKGISSNATSTLDIEVKVNTAAKVICDNLNITEEDL